LKGRGAGQDGRRAGHFPLLLAAAPLKVPSSDFNGAVTVLFSAAFSGGPIEGIRTGLDVLERGAFSAAFSGGPIEGGSTPRHATRR